MTKEERAVDAFVEIMKDYKARQDDVRFDALEEWLRLYEPLSHLYDEITQQA